MDKGQTKKELQEQILRYENLIGLARLASSSLDYKNIRKRAVSIIKKIIPCEKFLVYQSDEKGSSLNCVLPAMGKKAVSTEVTVAIDESQFVGACAYRNTVIHVADVTSDIRAGLLDPHIKKMGPRSMLLSPMVNKGHILGVIQIINLEKTKLDETDFYFLESITHEMAILLENVMLFEKIQAQFIHVVQSLADAIGKKDTYTGGHTRRVGHFADMIAQEMELTVIELHDLKLASVLHDVGKIGIEDKILKKSAPLTDEEFEVMREHPRLGYEILGHINGLEEVIDAVRYHHERYDGKGYPYGLKGEDIPVLAQIISVADTFDAMISTRPYRKGLPPMVAYDEILKHSGSQFGPKVVEAFKKAFEKTNMYRSETDQVLYKKAS